MLIDFIKKVQKYITKNSLYFTLVLKDERKFEVLEKNSNILDVNNNSFINDKINCLNIMLKIIKNKFNNHIDYEFPHTKIEILGFIYSAIFEDFGDFKLIDPIIDENSLLEPIDNIIINKDITYIEPILFNEHISIFFFSFNKYIRLNLLIDPSLYHVEIMQKDREF